MFLHFCPVSVNVNNYACDYGSLKQFSSKKVKRLLSYWLLFLKLFSLDRTYYMKRHMSFLLSISSLISYVFVAFH